MGNEEPMNDIKFRVLLRHPVYPVIIISRDRLFSAVDVVELAQRCVMSAPFDGKNVVSVIDSAAEEFWYMPDQYGLAPGPPTRKWTKKEIVETYNQSANATGSGRPYPVKSISAKRRDKIIRDICEMIRV